MNKLLYIPIVISCLSCSQSTEDKRLQAITEMNIKIEILKSKKKLECEAQAFIQAEVYVDSVIEAMLLNPIDNNMYTPPVPPKPKYIRVDSSVFNSQSSVKAVIEN